MKKVRVILSPEAEEVYEHLNKEAPKWTEPLLVHSKFG